MSKNRKKIAEAIQTMSAPVEDTVMSGYVKDVDESKATMSVVLNLSGQVVEGVMLHALAGSLKGMIVIPEQDSDVVICSVDGSGEYMLLQADKIKKVLLDISNIQAKVSDKIEINCDEIVFNGGNNGGMVLIQKLLDKLNKIEDWANDFKVKWNAFCNSYVAGSPSSTGAPTSLTNSAINSIVNTQLNDLENVKIKQ